MKSIIFDLDGTLVYTDKEYITETVEKTLKTFGNVRISKENIYKFWFGSQRSELIASWGIDPIKFWKNFHDIDKAEMREKHTKPYDDCWVLNELKKKGVKICLLSSAQRPVVDVEARLLKNKFNIDFDVIITTHENNRKFKPDPGAIIECMNMIKAEKQNTIHIGNSDEDMLAAKNAGILDLYINRGEHEIHVKPTITIKSLEELLDMVEND